MDSVVIQSGPKVFDQFYNLVEIKNYKENAKFGIFGGYIHKSLSYRR